MRIRRLGLLRYGCFTDVLIDFDAQNPDFEIVFGPNEAGKSTALSAIEDLLFGIPYNSSLNFLHDYRNMRVGGVIERDGRTLEAHRRKGKKDTLLRPDGDPIPIGAGALVPFLANADRAFFERMFSLDHERLRQGGREILDARDEVGQTLFSASAGITGLRDVLKALADEAAKLWAPRRAAKRKYYQAEDRLKEARRALREHTVRVKHWEDLKRDYETARDAYDALETEIETKSTQLQKLTRIRRVYRDVRKKGELDAQIKDLDGVMLFPEDARNTLDGAESTDEKAKTRIETLNEQLKKSRDERGMLTCDKKLLLHGDDIQQYRGRRIEVQKEKADLPKRRAELEAAERDIKRLARELGWGTEDADQLIQRIPARARVTSIRALLSQRGARLSTVNTAREAAEEVANRIAELQQRLTEKGDSMDVSTLVAVIRATRQMGDLASEVNAAEKEARETQDVIEKRLKSLRPAVANEETLIDMPIAPRSAVEAHYDQRRKLDERIDKCSEHSRAAEQELERLQKTADRVAADEDAVLPEELARVRRRRDAGWALVRRRYVEGDSVAEEEVRAFAGSDDKLTETYEIAVSEADVVADRRFDKAEATARLAEISRQITQQEVRLEGVLQEERALEEQSRKLEAAWANMWSEAPFEPLAPEDMLDWLNTREQALDLIDRRAAVDRELATLRLKETHAKKDVLAELAALGYERVATLEQKPLRVVVEGATEVERQHEKEAERRRHLEEELRKARADFQRKSVTVEKAQIAWEEWERHWSDAVSGLGLTGGSDPEAIAAQATAIDEMREIAVTVNQLRHERIGKINRDLEAFEQGVSGFVGVVAPDLVDREPEEAVLELERRLESARQIRERQQEKDRAIASLEEQIKQCEESRRDAREVIDKLQETAGVGNIDDLRDAIETSDRLRELQTELSHVEERLIEEGDGLSVAELEADCDAVDLDEIAARQLALEQELEELREGLMEEREKRTAAQQNFEAIGGDDAAAKAAATKEEALAELEQVAERYVRVRSSALLLEWAIDRYRREKQAPLLRRAGKMFATLTDGSFSDLRVDFDERDRAHLIGLRPDDATVAVQGMSTGTADQLYLALRIASVEDYLVRATPLPFIADDLFINFDDERAAAGFKVLGELASRTQVLFFTHHRHLVDIAHRVLGASVPVIALGEGSRMARTSAVG